ncbi:hypothetical protein HELRODRAFT_81886 [Helobdella robusta]|uniref:PHD-type domain-containing protein n=1 Tax=Helobdella robusta TaxID=6412 RepID=T1G4K3_HELRO|nr:hypothetical protein HELRODRAFT_81886 [Helobdella robusta]ESO01295.1 hypothetical protein HELRODRAFT_81886 [Helobdella robusta]
MILFIHIQDCGRLLYMGQNEWVHVNCALWSAEVYEETDGLLQKVYSAVARGRKLRCDACGKPGATVGCCQLDCNANFHFPCARRKNCAFVESKKVFCSAHVAFADGRLLSKFDLEHRLCLDMESNKYIKKQWLAGLNHSTICILVG